MPLPPAAKAAADTACSATLRVWSVRLHRGTLDARRWRRRIGAAAVGSPRRVIYWRQNLLTVPYQLNSARGAGAAKSVWLYVSKDRGITWQQVSDAQPQLLAFNYRAEADGEYWFAIRTTDAHGRDARAAALPGSAGDCIRSCV